MSLPTIEPLPDENASLPPARRRQRRRMIVPPGSDERAEYLGDLSRRVVPSFDFFLFSLLAGLVLGGALLIDSPALAFLAALLAPFMGPMVGISLGTITGAVRFVLSSAASLGIGSLIVFLCGLLAGWVVNLLPSGTYQIAAYHSQFTWPGFLVLALGAGLTTFLIVRSLNQRPLVTSVAIAYGLYLPVGTAGFGLSSGVAGLWPGGLVLFLSHLVWAALIGTLVLGLLGLRPLKTAGYLFGLAYGVFGLVALVLLAGPGLNMANFVMPPSTVSSVRGLTPVNQEPTAVIAQQITVTPAAAIASPTKSATITATPPRMTATPTRTLIPSATATETITPIPTPVYAYISAEAGDGAIIRESASYKAAVVQSLLNGTLVEVMPDVIISDKATWVHVRTAAGKEGWIVRLLLKTATPAAGW